MSGFADLAERADLACEAAFGEAFTLRARTAVPSGPSGPDATRADLSVIGLFRRGGVRAGFSVQRNAMEQGRGTGFTGADIGLGLRRSALAWQPRRGDHAVRVTTGEVFAVEAAEAYGPDGLDLRLVRA